MKQVFLTVAENKPLTKDVFLMTLCGDVSQIKTPGQFINIKLDGFYLRRPISVCDSNDKDCVTIIYKAVGEGTKAMSALKNGHVLDVLTGLGNGFDVALSGDNPILIGGGVGTPPMYYLAKKLIEHGKNVTVIIGFNTADEVFFKQEFEKLGAKTVITTVDGSVGVKGFVTDALKDISEYSYTYACGPKPMLKAVYNTSRVSGQYSFEERMGCGFGACMGCSCKTKYGNKRICKDGPVLVKEEIIW